MRILAAALGLVLSVAAAVRAEPLDLKQVAADAKWLAQVDVDAMKAATIVQRAYDCCQNEWPETADRLADVGAELGLDLTQDLHGLTFYGTEIRRDAGVVIVQANADQAHLLQKVQGAPDYRTSTYGSHTLHTWTHDKGKRHERSVTGCFYTPTVVVFGRTAAEVMAALDVLDGKLPSLAGKSSPMAAAAPAGAMFVARITGLGDVKLPFKSPLVRQSKALGIVLGEYDGESFAMVKLTTKANEVAEQVLKVVEGARAMAILCAEDQPDVLEVINAVKVGGTDQAVTVQLRASADDVWEHGKMLRHRLGEKKWLKPWWKHFGGHE